MAIQNEEMLSTFGKGKLAEVHNFQSKKRKFFKKKGNRSGAAAKKNNADIVCYKCDKKGHYANECRSGNGRAVAMRPI